MEDDGVIVEFLGTGGAMTIPRPLCSCDLCVEAREKGVPYSRMGPSIFVHGPDLLIDTPEEINQQINRSSIHNIKGIIYSHWHPDHVMGRRIIESLTADWLHYPPQNKSPDVYLPEQVAKDFTMFLGSGDHLAFFKEQGYANVKELVDGQSVTLNGTIVTPFRLEEEYVYAFMLEGEGKRVLIAIDELNNWQPKEAMKRVDVAILPVGIFEHHPLTGERIFQKDHPVLQEEATFTETLEVIEKLQAKKVLLTHIEELNQLTYQELKKLEAKARKQGFEIEFAYDTQRIQI